MKAIPICLCTPNDVIVLQLHTDFQFLLFVSDSVGYSIVNTCIAQPSPGPLHQLDQMNTLYFPLLCYLLLNVSLTQFFCRSLVCLGPPLTCVFLLPPLNVKTYSRVKYIAMIMTAVSIHFLCLENKVYLNYIKYTLPLKIFM